MSTLEAILILALGAAIGFGVQRFINERKAKAAAKETEEK